MKKILVWALANKDAENRSFHPEGGEGGADLYYAEILHRHYGFPTRNGFHPRKKPCNRIFQPNEIGQKRYHTAQAVVSRACLTLHIHGLARTAHSARSTWAGIILTPTGAELARALEKAKRD